MNPVATLIDTSATTDQGELASSRDDSTSPIDVRLNDHIESKPNDKLKDARRHSKDTFTPAPWPQEQLENARLKKEPVDYNGLETTGQRRHQDSTYQSCGNVPDTQGSLMSPVLKSKDASKVATSERRNNKEATTLNLDRAFSDHTQRLRKDTERHSEPLCVS